MPISTTYDRDPALGGQRFNGGDEGSAHLAQQLVAREALTLMLAEEPGEVVRGLQAGNVAVQKEAVDELVLQHYVVVK